MKTDENAPRYSYKTSALASEMKQGLGRFQNQMKVDDDNRQFTPDEYAGDKIRSAAEDVSNEMYGCGKVIAVKIRQKPEAIKQTAKSCGRQTFKVMEKDIKTSDRFAQNGAIKASGSAPEKIRFADKTAKNAERSVEAAKKAAKRSAQARRKAAESAKETAKAVVKATKAAVKAMSDGITSLAAAIAVGGWIAVLIIVLLAAAARIIYSGVGA